MLFAVSVAEKLKNEGVTAFSLHPGIIITNLMRHMPDDAMQAMGTL
jgi:NAD(P)-dependent dehydrogenase (short-subunit alcohol dehydrogenase family)